MKTPKPGDLLKTKIYVRGYCRTPSQPGKGDKALKGSIVMYLGEAPNPNNKNPNRFYYYYFLHPNGKRVFGHMEYPIQEWDDIFEPV